MEPKGKQGLTLLQATSGKVLLHLNLCRPSHLLSLVSSFIFSSFHFFVALSEFHALYLLCYSISSLPGLQIMYS